MVLNKNKVQRNFSYIYKIKPQRKYEVLSSNCFFEIEKKIILVGYWNSNKIRFFCIFYRFFSLLLRKYVINVTSNILDMFLDSLMPGLHIIIVVTLKEDFVTFMRVSKNLRKKILVIQMTNF